MPALWLPWKLPHFNALIEDAKITRKTKCSARFIKGKPAQSIRTPLYAATKRRWNQVIAAWARAKGFEVLPGCWAFTYLFVEESLRRDPSNISSGAVKLIEDALVSAHLLEDDGWAQVDEIHQYFATTRQKDQHGVGRFGVLVHVGPRQASKQEMLAMAKVMCRDVPVQRTQQRYKAKAVEAAGGTPGSGKGDADDREVPAGDAAVDSGKRPKTSRPANSGDDAQQRARRAIRAGAGR